MIQFCRQSFKNPSFNAFLLFKTPTPQFINFFIEKSFMRWLNVLGFALVIVLVLVLISPPVAAGRSHNAGFYVYSGNVYRTPNYIGSYVVNRPVALYSYNAFVQPIRPISFTPYYTSYSIPVYSGNRYFAFSHFPRFHRFSDLEIDVDIDDDDFDIEIDFDD